MLFHRDAASAVSLFERKNPNKALCYLNRLEDINMFLKGKVILNKQECTGDFDFSIQERYMTIGFQNVFGKEASQIAFTAISLIMETYPHNADYLQTFKYIYPDGTETAFWIIHDRDHYTLLLPDEY